MSPAPATAPSRRTTSPTKRRNLSSVRPPRRVSGPASGRRTTPAAPAHRLPRPLAAVARVIARVSRHPLIDRVISGRWSIALIAFALIGIVTLQLGLLKLNVGVGRSLEREQTLERENATLGIENAELASPERIRQLATRLGMSAVSLTELRFVGAAHGSHAAAAAAARLHAPVHPAGETGAQPSTRAGSEASASGEASSSETSSGEASSGETSSGETSSSETSSSEASSGEASGDEATGAGTSSSSESQSRETASAESPSPTGGEGQASEAGQGG